MDTCKTCRYFAPYTTPISSNDIYGACYGLPGTIGNAAATRPACSLHTTRSLQEQTYNTQDETYTE